MNFKNTIEIDVSGMCDKKDYYEIEDLYQAFKKRYEKENNIENISDSKKRIFKFK